MMPGDDDNLTKMQKIANLFAGLETPDREWVLRRLHADHMKELGMSRKRCKARRKK